MASNYTTLLQFVLPTTGEDNGTWGDLVNVGLSQLIDDAIAGAVTLSADSDTTLSTANGAADQARMAIINCTSSRTTTRNITAPATSKLYAVINGTTGGFSVVIRGAGPTTGITVLNGQTVFVAWNGSDFVKVAGSTVAAASEITGTLAVGHGGTGATTLTLNNVVLGNGTSAVQFVAPGSSGNLLTSNGTTWSSTAPATSGTVTSVAASVPSIFSISGSPITTSGTLAMTYSGTALPVANGGTGATTLTANNVILGNTTSAVQFVAPGTSGNLLTSNGTTWQSTASSFGYTGFRNRIINGDMRIDQRNAFATVAPSTTAFGPDRFHTYKSTAGATATCQALSTGGFLTGVGLSNFLKWNNTVAAAPAAGDINGMWQSIEGLNLLDFGLGNASAATFTVSFQFISDQTGSYSIQLTNGAANRSYVHVFTIAQASTWQQISFTVTGDTTGTWATDNTTCLLAFFDMGSGSTFETASTDTWIAGNFKRTSGCNKIVNLVKFAGFTGLQIEIGSVATTFEQRPLPIEFLMCQRYYQAFTVQVETIALGSTTIYQETAMRSNPTIAGGGAGFAVATAGTSTNIVSQTAAAAQALTFSSEI